MRPADDFCVARKRFMYIVSLVQKAQELKYAYILHRCIAITTALVKLCNIKVLVDMYLILRSYAFVLSYALSRRRYVLTFVLSCKHRLSHPVIPSLSDALDFLKNFSGML